MGETLNLRARGLYTFPNDLSAVPKGAFLLADNAVVDKDDVLESRRGWKQYSTAFSHAPQQLFEYQDHLIAWYNNKLAYDNGSAVFTDYSGSFATPLTGYRLRSVQANKNFYVTSSTGVRKLDAYNAAFTNAGGIQALDGTGTTTGVSGFLANNFQVAYRMVWGYTDANGNLILGAPSQRVIVANVSGGTCDVSLTFTIPAGVTTSYFYQIYRSGQFPTSVEPDDELRLVYEDNPTGGEIAAKSFTITDSTPDSLMGASLYTDPSQEGIANANLPPPLCTDMTYYRQYNFFGNTKQPQRLTITYLGGLLDTNTITIGGTVYTADKSGENAATGHFQVFEAGGGGYTDLGTPALNVQGTAQSLVRVINKYASNTSQYAYYLSGYQDLPGIILLQNRVLGASSFPVISNNGDKFNPTLPTSGTSVSSNDDAEPNAVYYSKASQPEAVPLGNKFLCGSADKPVLRIVALRETMFILKEDGIFRLTGTDPNSFTVTLLDNTAVLQGLDSAAPFNNQVWCMSNQGVLAISDTGVAVMSRPIERDLIKLTASQYAGFPTATFGIPYESERKYILWTVTNTTDTYATQAYVYNSFTNVWTRWLGTFDCGFVNPYDNKMYLGNAVNKYIYQERKTYTTSDYADDALAVTVTGYSGTTVSLSSTTGVLAGMSLEQGMLQSYIVSVTNGTDIVVEDALPWANGAATANTAIAVDVQWTPQTADNPGILKHFTEVTLDYSTSNFNVMRIAFNSNFYENFDFYNLTPITGNGFGTLSYGTGIFGAGQSVPQGIRTYVPLEAQRALWISPRVQSNRCFAGFALNGISIQWEPMTSRFF